MSHGRPLRRGFVGGLSSCCNAGAQVINDGQEAERLSRVRLGSVISIRQHAHRERRLAVGPRASLCLDAPTPLRLFMARSASMEESSPGTCLTPGERPSVVRNREEHSVRHRVGRPEMRTSIPVARGPVVQRQSTGLLIPW